MYLVWCHLCLEQYANEPKRKPWHQQRFLYTFVNLAQSYCTEGVIRNNNLCEECLSPCILVTSVQSNNIPSSIRLFGLVGIIYTDCSAPLALHVRPYLDWPQCASPAVILALYWLLATETRFYFIKVCMKFWLLNIYSKGTVTWLIYHVLVIIIII